MAAALSASAGSSVRLTAALVLGGVMEQLLSLPAALLGEESDCLGSAAMTGAQQVESSQRQVCSPS